MFSNGQLTFGIISTIVFFIVMFFMYRKDKNLHKKYYKGSIWVLIAFIAFLLFIIAIKFVLG